MARVPRETDALDKDETYTKVNLADCYIFERSAAVIEDTYGKQFLDSIRTNYLLIGPRHESVRHYYLNGYHILSLPAGSDYEYVNLTELLHHVTNTF